MVDYYYIPDEMTGKVIGKSGATVHTIQSLSGCHIDIPQHCEPSEPGKPLRRKVCLRLSAHIPSPIALTYTPQHSLPPPL